MRIQHNIMAMSAYRNYTNNVSAMKANLEKLSSGYKINRAGDDAAGLAISEKMRAQITGLETAQKNAKDGISLVQTAEGALTEVHDMLNRMVELATQSANGTYDNDTDRAQLQKEMDQLRNEINRIADSSNFNGIKLLDGSMDSESLGEEIATGTDRMIQTLLADGDSPIAEVGLKTMLDGGSSVETKTKFTVDFSGLVGKEAGTAAVKHVAKSADVTALTSDGALTICGTAYNISDTGSGEANEQLEDQLASWVEQYNADASNTEWTASVTSDKKSVTFTAKTAGALSTTNATAPTGATQVTAGADADPDDVGDPDFSFTIGGTELAASVTVSAGDGATEIATAVFGALTDTETGETGMQVKIGDNTYTVTDNEDGTLTFELFDDPTSTNIPGNYDWDLTMSQGDFDGAHTAGTVVVTPGSVEATGTVANTVFEVKTSDIADGNTITIDGVTVTLAVGKDSTIATKDSEGNAIEGVIDLTNMSADSIDLDLALSKISEGFAEGTENFIVGVNNTGNGDVHAGLTVHKKDDSKETYDTMEKLGGVFSINAASTGKSLTLQIGDTADDYNQLKVNIKDCHTSSLGIAKISIANQEDAQDAVDAIKKAINYVSDVRGTLGATQNRLDHTINNLSVMTENIQDAESTIRDVDIAEEMMAYTKNNILIQASQAMLAQANQVPQGVLQLLQ